MSPVFDTLLYGTGPEGIARAFQVRERQAERPDMTILPGEYAKLHLKNMDHIDEERLYVAFSDANRIEWKYDLWNQELSKLKYRRGPEPEEMGRSIRPKLD